MHEAVRYLKAQAKRRGIENRDCEGKFVIHRTDFDVYDIWMDGFCMFAGPGDEAVRSSVFIHGGLTRDHLRPIAHRLIEGFREAVLDFEAHTDGRSLVAIAQDASRGSEPQPPPATGV